jgi:hypothetical protein
LQERYKPYQTSLLYRLDLIGMRTLTFTLMMSIVYYLRQNNPKMQEGLSVPLIFINVLTILAFLYAIRNPREAKMHLEVVWRKCFSPGKHLNDDDLMNPDRVVMKKNVMRQSSVGRRDVIAGDSASNIGDYASSTAMLDRSASAGVIEMTTLPALHNSSEREK